MDDVYWKNNLGGFGKKYDDNNKLILNSIARITAGDNVRDRNRRTCRRVHKEKKSSLCIVCGLWRSKSVWNVKSRARFIKIQDNFELVCVYVYYIRDCYLA